MHFCFRLQAFFKLTKNTQLYRVFLYALLDLQNGDAHFEAIACRIRHLLRQDTDFEVSDTINRFLPPPFRVETHQYRRSTKTAVKRFLDSWERDTCHVRNDPPDEVMSYFGSNDSFEDVEDNEQFRREKSASRNQKQRRRGKGNNRWKRRNNKERRRQDRTGGQHQST